MKLIQASVVVLKNKPMTKKERKNQDQKMRGRPEDHSIFIRVTAEDNGKELVGLGEARPSTISEETLSGSARFARKIARRLVREDVQHDVDVPSSHVHDVVDGAVNDTFGIGESRITEQRPCPSVCFAVESALLDLIAKRRGVSMAELFPGSGGKSIERNVFSEPLRNMEKLRRNITNGKAVNGWLRLSKRLSGSKAATLVNSVLFALGETSPDMQGIILNAGQRWSIGEWSSFCETVNLTGLAAKKGVSIIVEDPFPEQSDAFYQQAFAEAEGTPIRIMLAKPVWGAESIQWLAPYIPYVDIKITPQKAGGYHAVLEAEKVAKAHGFEGGVFLAGINSTTNLNTLAMVTLANAMQQCRYFSTSFKKEKKVRLVHPQASLKDNILTLPEGSGLATNLCRSGLRRRLVGLNAYSEEGVVNFRQARRALMTNVYDDRFLHRDEAPAGQRLSDSELSKILKSS